MTIGTMSRAYAEAEQCGRISGEVGCGTYVRRHATGATFLPGDTPGDLHHADFIDLSINRPSAPGEGATIASALRQLA